MSKYLKECSNVDLKLIAQSVLNGDTTYDRAEVKEELDMRSAYLQLELYILDELHSQIVDMDKEPIGIFDANAYNAAMKGLLSGSMAHIITPSTVYRLADGWIDERTPKSVFDGISRSSSQIWMGSDNMGFPPPEKPAQTGPSLKDKVYKALVETMHKHYPNQEKRAEAMAKIIEEQ